MDWELLKKIDPTKLIGGERVSPFDLITGDKEKLKASKDHPITGLYYKKPSLHYNLKKGLGCTIEFFVPHNNTTFDMGLLKTITVASAERYFAEACKHVVKNKPQKALSRLGDVLNKDPQHTDAYYLMGCILMEAEQFDKANSCFQKVLLCQKSLGKDFKKYLPTFHITLNLNLSSSFCIFPELLGASLLVAVSYWENNKREDALAALEQTASIFPKNSAVLYLKTYFKIEIGKHKEIVKELSDFEPTNSMDLSTYTLYGAALYSSYDPSTAVQILKNALKFAERFGEDEQNKLIHYHLGRAYLNKGDKFEGLQELKKLATIDPAYLDVNSILQDVSLGAKPYSKEKLELPKEERPIASPKKEKTSETITPAVPSKIINEEPFSKEEENISKSTKVISDALIPQSVDTSTTEKVASENIPRVEKIEDQTFTVAKLIIQQTGEVFPIKNQDSTTIGRESVNEISFPNDFSISRRQSKIIFHEGGFFVEDLGGTNGTYLNKRRITKRMPLKNNDEIQIGKKNFTFILE